LSVISCHCAKRSSMLVQFGRRMVAMLKLYAQDPSDLACELYYCMLCGLHDVDSLCLVWTYNSTWCARVRVRVQLIEWWSWVTVRQFIAVIFVD